MSDEPKPPQYAIVKIIDEKEAMSIATGAVKLWTWPAIKKSFLDSASIDRSAQTVVHEKRALKKFEEFLGRDPSLDEITPVVAEDFRSWLAARYSQNTVRIRLCIAKAVFTHAIRLKIILANPFAAVRLPKIVFAGKSVKDSVLRAFLSNLPQHVRRACKLALYTGMRRGEILSLDWSQVKRHYIIIPKEKSKSKRERCILLNSGARRTLGRHGAGRVFAFSGHCLNRYVTIAWRKIGERVRFHDLRHTAATRYMEKSGDAAAMCDAFGWANEESARPYQHITPTRARGMLRITYAL